MKYSDIENELEKLAQNFGVIGNIRESLNFGGKLFEVSNSEYREMMNNIRQIDSAVRSIITGENKSHPAIKDLLNKAKKNLNRREYLEVVANCVEINEIVKEASNELKNLNLNFEKTHYQLLSKNLSNQDLERLRRRVRRALDLQQSYGFKKQAGIMDFFHNVFSTRGRELKAWEKRFPKSASALKRAASNSLRMANSIYSSILNSLDRMKEFRIGREIESYKNEKDRLLSRINNYSKIYDDYYRSAVEPIVKQVEQSINPEISYEPVQDEQEYTPTASPARRLAPTSEQAQPQLKGDTGTGQREDTQVAGQPSVDKVEVNREDEELEEVESVDEVEKLKGDVTSLLQELKGIIIKDNNAYEITENKNKLISLIKHLNNVDLNVRINRLYLAISFQSKSGEISKREIGTLNGAIDELLTNIKNAIDENKAKKEEVVAQEIARPPAPVAKAPAPVAKAPAPVAKAPAPAAAPVVTESPAPVAPSPGAEESGAEEPVDGEESSGSEVPVAQEPVAQEPAAQEPAATDEGTAPAVAPAAVDSNVPVVPAAGEATPTAVEPNAPGAVTPVVAPAPAVAPAAAVAPAEPAKRPAPKAKAPTPKTQVASIEKRKIAEVADLTQEEITEITSLTRS